MAVRLAGGVAAGADLTVWLPTPAGPHPVQADAGSGRPVAVGPAGADPAAALAELAALVEIAGVDAAGAGVGLGGGFWSARLAGARGDRRDAVLAALRAIGPDRLGDRAAVLVALFGPAATKPVGAAAGRAVDEGRWSAVHLASAASDLLGPERLEDILGWPVAPGADPVPHGRASDLARHLAVVLGPVAPARRPRLLRSLWDAVSVRQSTQAEYRAVRNTQSTVDLTGALTARRQAHRDEATLRLVRDHYGHEPSLVEAARWTPDQHDISTVLRDLVDDALAATILLRAAEAVARHGPAAGLAAARPLLTFGAELLDAAALADARGADDAHPARPACAVHDLAQGAGDAATILSTARDHGRVVFEAVEDTIRELFAAGLDPRQSMLGLWATGSLDGWRRVAGYRRDPATWEQAPVFHDLLGLAPLATRLHESPGQPPADIEVLGDLLWFADLADGLAVHHRREAAGVRFDQWGPVVWPEGRPGDDEGPLRQVLTSVPLAVAGAAQLVSIGGLVPERCVTWADLVDGLLATEELAEGRTGPFLVPEPLGDLDGGALPGTDLRVELARDSTALARWANYMGNCIASLHYVAGAQRGRRVLAALIGPDGRPVANLELRRGSPTDPWTLSTLLGRFNADPDPELARAVREWVAGLRAGAGPIAAPAPPAFNARDNRVDPHGGRGTAEPPARDTEPIRTVAPKVLARRLLDDIARPLGALVAAELSGAAARESLAVVAALAGRGTADPVTDLRRATEDRVTEVVRAAIGPAGRAHTRPLGFAGLWAATAVRPLATAVAALPEETRDRYPALERLVGDDELPRSLRQLVRTRRIAPGRALDAVNARLRAALGRLARAGDPALAKAVAAESTTESLCALATAVTLWGDVDDPVRVVAPRRVRAPGYPASSLNDPDGPWQRSWPAVRDLGAPVDEFWDRIAVTGLVVPAAWLGGVDWTVLWRRAAARARAAR